MKRLLLCSAIACALPLIGTAQDQQTQPVHPTASSERPAKIQLFVFDGFDPAAGLTVVDADHESDVLGRTNANGALFFDIAGQSHQVEIVRADEVLHTLDLNLIPGERAQIIVTLKGESAPPVVMLESSNQAASLGSNQAVAAPEQPVGNPGQLTGQIVSLEDGAPLANARVFVSGTPFDLRTDGEGRFNVELPAGSYSISVLHADHSTQTIDDVAVSADETADLTVELTPVGLELPEFVVLEPHVEGSLAGVIEERRNSAAVADVLGAEAIGRAGDSDAASALKRVTGLTLVGGKFIYVRGLGERYSTTLVNGAAVPSPDPTRRVVPLDLFPVSIVESILVQKSFSAEMPGAFGGGTVQIRTTGVPDGPLLAFNASLGYVDGTTTDDYLTYPGGDRDYLGRDDGTRSVPPLLANEIADGRLTAASLLNPDGLSAEELTAISNQVADATTYDVSTRSADPEGSASLSIGNSWNLGEHVAVGGRAALRYDRSFDKQEEIRREFSVSGDSLVPLSDLIVERSEAQIDTSAFVSGGVELGDRNGLEANYILLRQTRDEVQIAEGDDFNADTISRFTEFDYEENELETVQLRGDHKFALLGDTQLNWQYTDASATRDAPKKVGYRYDQDNDGIFRFSEQSDRFQQNYETLADDTEQVQLRINKAFVFSDANQLVVRADYSELDRMRDSSIRRFTYFGGNQIDDDILERPLDDILTDEFIGPSRDGLFVLREVTRATDAYAASQTLDAKALAVDYTFLDDYRVVLGARQEDNVQTVTTFQPFNPDADPLISELRESDWFPSAQFTWEYNDSSQIRFAYAQTVNRPEFREISPAPFTDPRLDQEVTGFPGLVSAQITHVDLRWEKYFSSLENLSVALFYKEIENPIEQIVIPGETRVSTFRNAEVGELAGIEMELNKGLGSLWEPLTPLTAGLNIAYIDSEVTIPEGLGANTNLTRELQGQSPYVINTFLGYESEGGDIKATILFNMFGERISEAGAQGLPDILEQPFEQLDVVYRHQLTDELKFGAKLKNILDPDVEFLQGGEVERSFNRGRELSFSLEWALD